MSFRLLLYIPPAFLVAALTNGCVTERCPDPLEAWHNDEMECVSIQQQIDEIREDADDNCRDMDDDPDGNAVPVTYTLTLPPSHFCLNHPGVCTSDFSTSAGLRLVY